jgi:hypothetical protein
MCAAGAADPVEGRYGFHAARRSAAATSPPLILDSASLRGLHSDEPESLYVGWRRSVAPSPDATCIAGVATVYGGCRLRQLHLAVLG